MYVPVRLRSWGTRASQKTHHFPNLTARCRVFPKKLTGPQLVKKFRAFYETEGSPPHSQAPATWSYPEPDPSSSCLLHPTSLRSILILPSHVCLGLVVSFPQVYPPNPYMYLSCLLYVPPSPPIHTYKSYTMNEVFENNMYLNCF